VPRVFPSNLADALRGRYVLERELGRGGMATVHQRPAPAPASRKPGRPTFSSRQNFYFWNGGLPPTFASGISSRPHDLAYSTAGAFLARGGGRTCAGPVPEQETTADYMGQQTRGVSPTATVLHLAR
jgi:hypothetical protein